jgi:hypothetical protein
MKKIFIILAGAVLIGSGCKKGYLDINTNPNSPTEGSITPDLVLPNALNVTANRLATNYEFLNRVFGQWAPSGSFSANSSEQTYNITTSFATGIWTGNYDNLYDYNFVETKAKAAGQTFYEGIAKVMKCVCFHELVDCYNNVPYTKAFDVTGNIRPGYDGGQAIYNNIFIQLDAARNLIKNADINKNPFITTKDIMFGGDKAKWRQFINTLALRLLIRQSQIPGFNPASEITKINTDGAGFITADASVSPGYLQDKSNPFWAAYGYTAVNVISNKFNYANPYVLDQMKTMNGGAGGPTSDIRYQYFFKRANNKLGGAVAASDWVGMPYGNPPQTSFSYDKVSNIGGIANDAAEVLITTAPKVGLCKQFDQRQWIITIVESNFLQAEALARGWAINTTFVNAQAAFRAAVSSSFVWLNVTNATAEATTLLNSTDVKIAWPATQAAQINVILYQKYIGLCGLAPLEIWSDWRRVSNPYLTIPLSIAPGRTSTTQFNRLLYPQVEYNVNTDNVAGQGTINQFTSKVFWDQ